MGSDHTDGILSDLLSRFRIPHVYSSLKSNRDGATAIRQEDKIVNWVRPLWFTKAKILSANEDGE
jgi:hypothetical protein